MELRNIMTCNVEAVDPDAAISEAARRMRRRYLQILVVQQNGRILGTVSHQDIVFKAVAKSMAPDSTRIRNVMTRSRWFCFVDQTITDARRIMDQRGVDLLPVLDRSQKLRGVVSRTRLYDADHEIEDHRIVHRRFSGLIPANIKKKKGEK